MPIELNISITNYNAYILIVNNKITLKMIE